MVVIYHTLHKGFDSDSEIKKVFYSIDEVLSREHLVIKKADFGPLQEGGDIRAACYYDSKALPETIIYLEAELKPSGENTLYLGARYHLQDDVLDAIKKKHNLPAFELDVVHVG